MIRSTQPPRLPARKALGVHVHVDFYKRGLVLLNEGRCPRNPVSVMTWIDLRLKSFVNCPSALKLHRIQARPYQRKSSHSSQSRI